MFNWTQKLNELEALRTPCVLVTVVKVLGSAPREPGTKMIVCAEDFFGTIGGGHLEELVLADARKLLQSEEGTQLVTIPLGAKAAQCCGGHVELFLEKIGTQPEVFIFGAGHVGQALAQALADTSFVTHLVDDREEWLEKPATLDRARRHLENPIDFLSSYSFREKQSFMVIMTYRHDLDEEILKEILKRDFFYVGLIGSKTKWERFRHRLLGRGVDPVKLQKVYCPIGLDLGDHKAPKEIAISIAAQLLQSLEAV